MHKPLGLLLLLSVALAGALASPALGADTRVWLGVRSGGAFFAERDPDDIEALVTRLSNPPLGTQLEFEPKSWEVPFGVRLGLEFNEWIRVYALYERIPYLLEREVSDTGTLQAPTESIRFESPANVFGGGIDILLADAAYGQALIVGLSAGVLDTDGRDQDVLFGQNFATEGSGSYFEIVLAGQYEFGEDVTFLPFIGWRVARANDTRWRRVRDLGDFEEPGDFDIDYGGVTLGLEGRFHIYPWGGEDEPDLPAGGRWER